MNPHDLDKEQRARLARMFEEYMPGERVRAVCTIVDAMSETEIAEGTIGLVREAGVHGCSPLFAVQWLPAGGPDRSSLPTQAIVTSAENLEPVDRPLSLSVEQPIPGALVADFLGMGPIAAGEEFLRTHHVTWKDSKQRGPKAPPSLALVPRPATPQGFDAGAFVTLCRFDLPDIRDQLANLERECRECFEDLEAVGVLRPGHEPPEGVAKVRARMPGLRASIRLIDVLLSKLGPAVGSPEGKR